MRIVIVGPVYPYRGGIAHYTALLARTLAERHQVLVVSFQHLYPAWLYPGDSDKDPSQQPLSVDAEFLLSSLSPLSWWQVARHIKQFRPDAVAFQWWTTFLAPAYASISAWLRRQGVRVLFVIHNVLPHEPRPWDAWLTRLTLQQGHAFLVHTLREKERLSHLVPDARSEVRFMPVLDVFTQPRLFKADSRRRLGLADDKPVLLFFGLVRPYKGLRYLIDAVATLRARGEVVQLVVAGEIWESKSVYVHQLAALGLEKQVRLEDRYIPNEEIPLFFSGADVFVAPYVNGTQSAAVRVAVSFGLPLVASEPAVADFDEEWTPFLRVVPKADATALADALQDAIHQPARPKLPVRDDWLEIRQAIEVLAQQ